MSSAKNPSYCCSMCNKPLTTKTELAYGVCDTCLAYLLAGVDRDVQNRIRQVGKKKRENQFVFR